MCTFEHVLGRLVEVHHVVLLDVGLVDDPSDLNMTLTKILMCHVYF